MTIDSQTQQRLREEITAYFRIYYLGLRNGMAAFYGMGEYIPPFFRGNKAVNTYFCTDGVVVVHYPSRRDQDLYRFRLVSEAPVRKVIDMNTNPLPNGDVVSLLDYTPGEDFQAGSYPAPFMVDEMGSVAETRWTRLDWASTNHLDRWRDTSVALQEAKEQLRGYIRGGR
jgi:hypothetical protein